MRVGVKVVGFINTLKKGMAERGHEGPIMEYA